MNHSESSSNFFFLLHLVLSIGVHSCMLLPTSYVQFQHLPFPWSDNAQISEQSRLAGNTKKNQLSFANSNLTIAFGNINASNIPSQKKNNHNKPSLSSPASKKNRSNNNHLQEIEQRLLEYPLHLPTKPTPPPSNTSFLFLQRTSKQNENMSSDPKQQTDPHLPQHQSEWLRRKQQNLLSNFNSNPNFIFIPENQWQKFHGHSLFDTGKPQTWFLERIGHQTYIQHVLHQIGKIWISHLKEHLHTITKHNILGNKKTQDIIIHFQIQNLEATNIQFTQTSKKELYNKFAQSAIQNAMFTKNPIQFTYRNWKLHFSVEAPKIHLVSNFNNKMEISILTHLFLEGEVKLQEPLPDTVP